MKHIVHLSFGSSSLNGEILLPTGPAQQSPLRITRIGADHNLDFLLRLIKQYAGKCDVIAFSLLPPTYRIGRKIYQHRCLSLIFEALKDQPFTLGKQIEAVYATWALEHALKTGAVNFQNSSVTMLSGIWQQEIKQTLAAKTQNIFFLDPWSLLGVKASISGVKNFDLWAKATVPALTSIRPQWVKDHRYILLKSNMPWLKKALASEIFVGCTSLLSKIDTRILENKTIFTDDLTSENAQTLKNAGVYNAFSSRFTFGDFSFKSCEVEALALLERIQNQQDRPGEGNLETNSPDSLGFIKGAKVQSQRQKSPLQMAELIDFVDLYGLKPQIDILYPDRQKPLRRFAFVIHPLAQDYIFKHPVLQPLKFLPAPIKNQMEKMLNKLPGTIYGSIKGIQSERTGTHAEGIIYTLFGTPRQLLDADPETIYKQLVDIAEDAARQGAQIIGLGAFTKIVGDAGVSVAARSPIPVTTGNSLSAAATLWAARDACSKLGFVEFDRKKNPVIKGRAMVIGATGSIGKACAKILSKLFSEIIITATNGSRLFQLKEEILEESPETSIHVTTQPSKYAADCELIVISTSAIAGGVLDLMTVKPGCVICDVSRPLTFKPHEAVKRPDVLIIESGEIELPGDISINCDIGLPDSIVYACLAETAILALEGRYETYTLSRDIATNKVLEIYKMTKKHGGRLAAIRGPQGIITDMDIKLCREHALKRLKAIKKTDPMKDALGNLPAKKSKGHQNFKSQISPSTPVQELT